MFGQSIHLRSDVSKKLSKTRKPRASWAKTSLASRAETLKCASRLARGHSSTLVLMVEGVKLGLPGATDGLAAGHPFAPVSELLAKFLAQGGRVALCASCLEHFGYGPADVVPGYEIITAGEVVDLLTAARGSLQVT